MHCVSHAQNVPILQTHLRCNVLHPVVGQQLGVYVHLMLAGKTAPDVIEREHGQIHALELHLLAKTMLCMYAQAARTHVIAIRQCSSTQQVVDVSG